MLAVYLEESRRWALPSIILLCSGDGSSGPESAGPVCMLSLGQRQGHDHNTCITVRAVTERLCPGPGWCSEARDPD